MYLVHQESDHHTGRSASALTMHNCVLIASGSQGEELCVAHNTYSFCLSV